MHVARIAPSLTNEAVQLIQYHKHLAQRVFKLSILLVESVRLCLPKTLPSKTQLIEQITHKILFIHQLLYTGQMRVGEETWPSITNKAIEQVNTGQATIDFLSIVPAITMVVPAD